LEPVFYFKTETSEVNIDVTY